MSASFSWVIESDCEKLGLVKKPIAQIAILKKDGEWQDFVFKVDSGAVMTFLGAGECDLLGYNLCDGLEHEFKAANNTIIKCYIHTLSMKVGTIIIPKVRIAFAIQDVGEFLLGRVEVFDFFNIEMQGNHSLTNFIRS